MSIIVEALVLLFNVIWLWLVAIYKALAPYSMQKQKDVKKQIVLVTGAGSGLGRLISLQFATLGSTLVLWDINPEGNKETAELVRSFNVAAITYTVDLSSRQDIFDTAQKVKSEVGGVDILVNNAGIVTGKKFLDCPDDLIEKTMDVNINAHFWTVKSFLPGMLSRNRGHVVNIVSSAGFFGVTGLADYCASKFAAVGFDESIRQEIKKVGANNVYTTVVCPYFIKTGMFDGVQSKLSLLLPILEPEEVVKRIMFAILTNQEMLLVPRILYVLLYLRGLFPVRVGDAVAKFAGVNDSMDEFVGRKKSK